MIAEAIPSWLQERRPNTSILILQTYCTTCNGGRSHRCSGIICRNSVQTCHLKSRRRSFLESNPFLCLATGSTLLEKLSNFVVVDVNKLKRTQGSHIMQKKTDLRNLSEFSDNVLIFSFKLLRKNSSGYGKWQGRIRIRITWLHTTQPVLRIVIRDPVPFWPRIRDG